MDKLSRFVIDTYPTKTAAKASPTAVGFVEPTAIEKRAYGRAFDSIGEDADFLAKFEGTPLAPNAVALAEQELAFEKRRLQRRMQRAANDNWEQDSLEEDSLRLQKQQLILQLYKMKATTPAPQPGDAVIGQPAPTQMGSEIGGGDTGSFPAPQEPSPKLSQLVMKQAALPRLEDVLHEPEAYRGNADASHLIEMGGNPYLPHPARKAILESYLQGRASDAAVADHADLAKAHEAHHRAMNSGGGMLLGALGGPLAGAGIGAGIGALTGRRGLGEIGAIAGLPLGMAVGGYLGHRRGVTPLSQEESQKMIDTANLHREMYAPLAKDEAAKEHLLHQLTARHYEDAMERAQEDWEDAQERRRQRYDNNYAKSAAIAKHAGMLRKKADIAGREYMRDAAKAVRGSISPADALRYGIPGISGAVHGAEQVPENRLVGALGGAAGGIGGSELGGMTGRAISNSVLGDLIGRVIGASAGQDLGARAARLMVT